MTAKPRDGKIVTFYSYKGGTGRSMALANVGWILASTGRRVLLIDWDLEAPGLHRYLHPFIEGDKELSTTPGLIDFFVDFSTASRIAHAEGTSDEKWYEGFASLVRYASPMRGGFDELPLEFVSAGRQDAGYGVLVTTFNWPEFYEKLGGGVFLEALKQRLRQDYDFVLIDSRTGISDTSGVCTVQMPDELVVLYTLNQQSIKGAASVAESADRLRRKSTGEPGLRIWPIPTRVELAEKDRLDAAQDVSRATFERYIGHLRRDERRNYWERVQVLYQAYYAYEEVLATFADRARTPNSMLSKMEAIAGLLARERVELKRIPERRRLDTKKAFERPPRAAQPTTRAGQVFVSYNPADLAIVQKVVERLTADGIDVWIDRTDLRPGDNWQEAISSAIRATGVVLYFVGTTEISKWREQEVALALAQGIRVIPVMLDDASFESLPPRLRMVTAAVVNTSDKSSLEEAIARLSRAVGSFLSSHREDAASPFDPDDPNRGRWGLDAIRNGRELSASVRDITDDYFEVTLVVQSVGPTPLEGEVEFHLHPTFAKPVQTVPVVDGRAVLSVPCWGAFTVGAVADGGRTTLELDLAADSSFPKTFTER